MIFTNGLAQSQISFQIPEENNYFILHLTS